MNDAIEAYWPMTPQRIQFERELIKDGFNANMLRLDQCDMERYESVNIQALWDLYRKGVG